MRDTSLHSLRPIKVGCFVLEGANSFAVVFYLYYLPFIMKAEYGFSDRDNLLFLALHGFIYIFGSWLGGRLSERWGPFPALHTGYLGMALALSFGFLVPSLVGQVVALMLFTPALCLIWPTLEALASRGETFQGTARMIGIYNLVWAAANALAFNSGGWLIQTLSGHGLDQRQVFFAVPLGLMLFQFGYTTWLKRQHGNLLLASAGTPAPETHQPEPAAYRQKVSPKRFLQMAWLANPFGYVAINTLAALLPRLAGRFDLTTAEAGIVFSLWFYARTASFLGLWLWTGWHYRFRWLLLSFVGLIGGFITVLLAPQLWLVITGQLVIGAAIGLMYYSSLFYSMDVGDTKTEHGGLHEAAIGVGIFAGPALGASAITVLPNQPGAGALAVTAFLLLGLGGLVWLRVRGGR